VKTKRAKGTIDLQAAELTAYEQALSAQAARFTEQLNQLEERCRTREEEAARRHSRELGELKGRIDAMTPEFARTLAGLLRGEGVGV
jgi:hypothetical protein